jgi:hypothetical protein
MPSIPLAVTSEGSIDTQQTESHSNASSWPFLENHTFIRNLGQAIGKCASMANKIQVLGDQNNKNHRSKSRLTTASNATDMLAACYGLPVGQPDILSKDLMGNKVDWHDDSRIQTVQRQGLVAKLGRERGNRYVQGLMNSEKSFKGDRRYSQTKPIIDNRNLSSTNCSTNEEEKQSLSYSPAHLINKPEHIYRTKLQLGSFSDMGSLFVQRGDEEEEQLTPEFFGMSEVSRARANMDLRFHRTVSYSARGREIGGIVKRKLVESTNQYEGAYDNYARVIRAAREEARNLETWITIGVGIGAGILMGLGAAFLLPSAAAGAFTITTSEALTAAASAAGQAAGSAIITSEVASALRPAGTELEPEGLHPNVLRMRVWRNVAGIYQQALGLVEVSRNLHMFSMAAEYLMGEIRVHVAGGATHMTQDEVLDLMEELSRADNAMQTHDQILANRVEALNRLEVAANSVSLSDYPLREMEQDIWILWMGELDNPSVLDRDAIENYLHGSIGVLGSNSRLGIDFGTSWYSWTSAEDERLARNAARREAGLIRGRLRRLEGSSI